MLHEPRPEIHLLAWVFILGYFIWSMKLSAICRDSCFSSALAPFPDSKWDWALAWCWLSYNWFCILKQNPPFQTKIFPLAPLSRMKQSSRTSRSFPNGLLSEILVIVMEPVASDTCTVQDYRYVIEWLMWKMYACRTYEGYTLYREAELERSALLSSSGMLSGSSGICPRTYRQKKQQDGWKKYKWKDVACISICC